MMRNVAATSTRNPHLGQDGFRRLQNRDLMSSLRSRNGPEESGSTSSDHKDFQSSFAQTNVIQTTLTVHARQGVTFFHNGSFRFSQFVESRMNGGIVSKQPGQSNVSGMVTRFRLEQAAVERGEFLVVHMLPQ
jgi:hypothetical protein